MKKLLSLLLALSLALTLFGCDQRETEPTEMESVETTQATELPTETTEITEETQPPIPSGMVCLEDVIAGSDIVMTVEGEKIKLEEDGLVLELSMDSNLGYRKGYVMVALQDNPVLVDGKVCIEERFCKNILGTEEREQPSLFYGMQFLAKEILVAIDQPEISRFNEKLVAEVARPGSMGIDLMEIDMSRYFHANPLSNYPDALKAELEGMGYGHAALYTYGEYTVLTGARMMDSLLIAQARELYPELADVDLSELTIWEYTKLGQKLDHEISIQTLTEQEITFAEERQIHLDDLRYLRKWFDQQYYGQYMEQSDEALKAALEESYQFNYDYLESAASSF